MTKTAVRRTVGGVVLVAVLGWEWSAAATESSAADQSSPMAPDARIRGLSVRIVAVINDECELGIPPVVRSSDQFHFRVRR